MRLPTPGIIREYAKEHGFQLAEKTEGRELRLWVSADQWKVEFVFIDDEYKNWYGGPLEKPDCFKVVRDVFEYERELG